MENKEKSLKEFVAGLDLSIINDEDSVLLDSMVGTSGAKSEIPTLVGWMPDNSRNQTCKNN